MREPIRIARFPTAIALALLVVLKLAFLFVFAWNSRFVMDEFVQLGWAKYLGNGLFDTVWHAKAVGYVLFYKIAHLIGWDATSTLLIGRIQTALLACGTLALTYGCARALGNDRVRSLVIVLILLSFSNFMERSFRTIAEPLAVFFAVAALFVVLRGNSDRARTLLAAGCLSGLSFLSTQKAIYFDVALGIALVADAALARRYRDGIARGALLVAGWFIPIVAYCFLFGGTNPLPIARNLFLGPVGVATVGGDAYGNLRTYVWQTLLRNALLYVFCLAGMALAWAKLFSLDGRTRIALIFTSVVTALVFAHNQPWPYVFIMALPFVSLWSVTLFDWIGSDRQRVAWAVLGIAIIASFGRNIQYLTIDNASQMDVLARAEALLAPDEVYFDGTAMLPNRMEPSTLWLDRATVLHTLREKENSDAWRILSDAPPKVIIWSYRMDAIEPVVSPLIRDSYVQVAPNVRLAGRPLNGSKPVTFRVPVSADYRLYDLRGVPVQGALAVSGKLLDQPFRLSKGQIVTLNADPRAALILPEGQYSGLFKPGPDDQALFANVYN